MLKKVVFLVADERQGSAIEKMKKNMGAEGEHVFYGSADDWEKEDMEECSKEDILFVTDSSIMLSELRQRGNYGIAFLHDHNRQEDFSGASYAVTDIEVSRLSEQLQAEIMDGKILEGDKALYDFLEAYTS